MIVDIVMPKMGESITEGTILEWRKEIGDIVELDEILLGSIDKILILLFFFKNSINNLKNI